MIFLSFHPPRRNASQPRLDQSSDGWSTTLKRCRQQPDSVRQQVIYQVRGKTPFLTAMACQKHAGLDSPSEHATRHVSGNRESASPTRYHRGKVQGTVGPGVNRWGGSSRARNWKRVLTAELGARRGQESKRKRPRLATGNMHARTATRRPKTRRRRRHLRDRHLLSAALFKIETGPILYRCSLHGVDAHLAKRPVPNGGDRQALSRSTSPTCRARPDANVWGWRV